MKTWICLALGLQLILAAVDSGPKLIRVSAEQQVTEKGHLDAYHHRNYSLVLPASVQATNWLFLAVEGEKGDPTQTPTVQLKFTNGSQLECGKSDASVLCTMNYAELKDTDTLFLRLSCLESCDYTITVSFSKELNMQLGKSFIKALEDLPSGLEAKLVIPATSTFTEFAVVATVDDPSLLTERLQLYMVAGAQNKSPPTRNNYTWAGVPAWNGGRGIFLTHPQVRPGDTVRVLLLGKGTAVVTLDIYTRENGLRYINMYTLVRDTLPPNSQRFYLLNLTGYKNNIANYSFSIELTKYSGKPQMFISGSSQFLESVKAISSLSNQNFQLTPERRQSYNIGQLIYIKVGASTDAVYEFFISLKVRGLTFIKEGQPKSSTIEADRADNLLYTYTAIVESGQRPPPTRIDIVLRYNNYLDFYVKRCEQYEVNATTGNCLISSRTDWQTKKTPQIYGDYHEIMGQSYFSFEYVPDKCSSTSVSTKNIYTCVFQIIVVRMPYSTGVVDYEIEVRKRAQMQQLQQGFVRRSHVMMGEVQKFMLSLVNPSEVIELRVYMTAVSGECYMIVSTNPQQNIANYTGDFWTSYTITENITSNYYIYIVGLEQSYFILSNHAVRSNQTTPAERSLIVLHRDVSQTFELDESQDLVFGLTVEANFKNFSVEVQNITGAVEYQIVPILNGEPVWLQPKVADSPKTLIPASTSQFAVKVRFVQSPAKFSIVYSLNELNCFISPLGQPILIKHHIDDVSSDRCIQYHITKAEDMEVVMTEPTFVFAAEGAKMNYTLNHTTTNIDSRFTKIARDKIKILCKALTSNYKKYDQESCKLQVNISNVPEDHTFRLVVQYTSKEMVLFDGMLQRAKGTISETLSRRFYYDLEGYNPISVFIRSKSKANYRILARLMKYSDFKKPNNTRLFPSYNQTSTARILASDTSDAGVTLLSIPAYQISSSNCGDSCVLLLSVFSKQGEIDADFKIEVTQSTVNFQSGQSQFGYVEKDTSRSYEIDITQETIIAVNTFHERCLTFNVLRLDQVGRWIEVEQNQGHFLAVVDCSQKLNGCKHLIRVTGTTGCTYQLTLSSTNYRLYELHEGLPFGLQLQQNDKVYFLYYHASEESFRFMSLSDYGDMLLSAEPLNASELYTIDTLRNSKRQFSFEQSLYGSLSINKRSNSFCYDCYYLLRVSALSDVSTSILLHTNSSAVALSSGKIVRETLQVGQYEQYTFYSPASFNITLDLLYGKAEVTVLRGIQKQEVVAPRTIINHTSIEIVRKSASESAVSQLDPSNSYLIRVAVASSGVVGYSISIAGGEAPLTLRKGIATNLHLKKQQTCLQFPSYSRSENLSIMIDSDQNVSNLHYWLQFEAEDPTSTDTFTEPDIEVAEYNILMKLHPLPGVFKLCMQAIRSFTDVSVILVGSETPVHLQINKQILFKSKSQSNSQILQVYSPSKGELMFEGFNCRGEINVFGSQDLNKLINRRPELRFEHTRVWGHYVATIKVDEGLYFLAADNRKGEGEDALSVLKYSFYKQGNQPYDYFDAEAGEAVESSVSNLAEQQGVTVVLKVGKMSLTKQAPFRVINHYYRFYISNNRSDLKQASQCNTAQALNKTRSYGADMASPPNTIQATFNAEEINSLNLENGTMYFTAVCYIELNSSAEDKHHANILKFIYQEGQLTLKQRAVRKYTTFDFIMWLVLPALVGLIVLICTLRYCVRKIYMGSSSLVEEDDPAPQESLPKKQLVSGADTQNVLALPSRSTDISIRDTGLVTKPAASPSQTPPPQLKQ